MRLAITSPDGLGTSRAITGSSSTMNTRTLGCYERAHIVGVSKTAYVLATPRCLQWRRGLQPTSTSSNPLEPTDRVPRAPLAPAARRRPSSPASRPHGSPAPERHGPRAHAHGPHA